MTISKENRELNVNSALAILLEQSAGKRCTDSWFTINQPAYNEILPTTWKVLADRGYVHKDSPFLYRFTGKGWLKAMTATDQVNSTLKTDIGVVMAVLKKVVNGRQREGLASLPNVAKNSNLPGHLVFNIIESKSIENVLQRQGVSWHGTPGSIISVPVDFGHDL